MSAGIEIEGLSELQGALRKAEGDIPKVLSVFLGKAAEMTKRDAQGLVPRGPSGAARASLRVLGSSGTRPVSTVVGGGSRAPYFGWLDFGGRTGIKNSVERRFVRGGR